MPGSQDTDVCVACRGTGRDPTYARRDVLCKACQGSVSTEAILSPEQIAEVRGLTPIELLGNIGVVLASHEALRAERDRYFDGLVKLYREHRAAVARVCDEDIDRSGALLGRIRAAAAAADTPEHEHEWVDASNSSVYDTELCLGCGAIRAAADTSEAKVYREHDNVIPQDDGEWAGPDFDTPVATCPPHDFGQDRRWERCSRCGADNPEEE